jgi:hypothetical protein
LEAELDEYGFFAGHFVTPWMSSKRLNVKFFKGKRGQEVWSSLEVETWGSYDFSVKVGVQLDREVSRASLLTLALPVPLDQLGDYTGFRDNGKTYHSICLHEAHLRLGPLSPKNMGLPPVVFVWGWGS